ncbi:CYTH domain-containing protein [Yoonia sp. BS5-3]|uniref:CYTH domain-containing protein n=1 Tax=Yoonia phaeophyticola TaxID=3137369 RepID=A0ABZ2V3C8_9RHOB
MAQEIERKFLVDCDHPEVRALLATKPRYMRQGYIMSDKTGVVRVRIANDAAFLTIKGPSVGIARDEFEYPIPVADAEAMLNTMCDAVLAKRRYYHPLAGGLMVELDVFEQIDLVLAEVELPDEQARFARPDWLVEEVSDDPQYFNNNIAARI